MEALPKPKLELHNCQNCNKQIEKKSYESRNRYRGRKYCSTKCAKDWMRKNGVGWFAPNSQTIKKSKEESNLPPVIWTKRDFQRFEEMYPELKDY